MMKLYSIYFDWTDKTWRRSSVDVTETKKQFKVTNRSGEFHHREFFNKAELPGTYGYGGYQSVVATSPEAAYDFWRKIWDSKLEAAEENVRECERFLAQEL